MKRGMDIFGEALRAYFHGDKRELFIEDDKGNKYPHSLSKYFRKYRQFEKLEKEIISLAKGKILDVGCGPGNYIPYLNKKGEVLGIDISPKIIKVCKERGIENVKVVDVFKFKTKEKFDTIVLLENNLGMAETIPRTKILLKKLGKMLNKNGKILTNSRDVTKGNYFNTKGLYYNGKMRIVWKNKKGDWICWISFNDKLLGDICKDVGMKMRVLDRVGNHYLAKITN
jgi:2-polyprenyl-3-methyl-5-hydroxy-6-metoxy-1,4-benzoquinol methylase